MRKKVLFVITKSNWGGAQRYVFDLATNLPKDEFDAQVAFGQRGRLADELQKAEIATHELQSLQRDVSLDADIKSFFELVTLFKKEKPDIVHLNSSKVGGLGSLAARVAGVKKIVFTAHGWPFWEKRSLPARMVIWFLSWLTVLCSHNIITVSQYDLRVAQKMPLSGKKVVRIYNGLAPIDFLPRETDGDSVRILTNAELNDNKNLFVGIDAVALARASGANITYSIMSDGELRPKLETYIEEKKYGSFISLLGFVPDGKRQYKKFDIFFLPSKKEGLPYVLLEAGLAALPVVASNVGGIPEIIDDTKSGFLCAPTDIKGFAEALTTLAAHSGERAIMGATLKEKVEGIFSLEQMLQKTLALYRR